MTSTSNSSDLFLFLILFHFSEAFHNVDTFTPFKCTGASYAWLCSRFTGHLLSILFSHFWTVSGSVLYLLSSSYNKWVSVAWVQVASHVFLILGPRLKEQAQHETCDFLEGQELKRSE